MMFSSVLTSATILLALALRASAHAMPSPALGVKGIPVRNDVQRPSNDKPCGNVDIASNIDTSTAVPVESDGTTVMLNVTNYNPGGDGSRSVSVLVDPTGTGKKFVAAKVTKNGNANPKDNGSDLISLSLPAGTTCTGGKAKNLCLLSVKSTAGFGGCTVVSQLASTNSGSGSTPAASGSTSAAGATKSKVPCSKKARRAAGTRAPRALRLAAESVHANPLFASTPL
ncbi:hypothetical protein MVEN_01578000 [Mycena venus]|uniref:Gas1-like protein n=1 Tax=Mycena venus TaxID=2733690 RepID=A0A8H6XSF0_9AGAR|nr:hypothetical protein MVEN_01578000 [Mycena venus]